MLAIIKTGGKQYKVSEGVEIRVEKLDQQAGEEVVFTDVLMASDGEKMVSGTDVKATVTGKVIIQKKAKKVLVFKQRRRKRYRRTSGHRQPYTAVEITGISIN
ncbi:MAG: 50S ribosomal protein L21 [Candidatus Cloacimonetes bacterium]|nr:50S ribosomal protein L21 [Candidatus Cloacimonadota bacterium]